MPDSQRATLRPVNDIIKIDHQSIPLTGHLVGKLTVSFEGVEFVTPSFLHETVAKLLAEVPSIVHSIQIEGPHA